MKLYNCRSYALLPRFAQNEFLESLCSTMDALVAAIATRCDALPCENSRAALAVCRDDELSQIADDLGVVPYYPDLARSTRENIIYQDKLWTRHAGTCDAVAAMVNALFDTETATVSDDLETPYLYHVDVTDNFAESSEVNYKRYHECLESIGHTTTQPDGFTFWYNFDVVPITPAISGDVVRIYDTDKLCEPVALTLPTVTCWAVAPGANLTFGNTNSRLYVGQTYPVYPESSSEQVDYVEGMICVEYTNYALHNSAGYASTNHWLYGSDNWVAYNDFAVINSNGKAYVKNNGNNNRILTGLLLTHIDGDYTDLIQIAPTTALSHVILAVLCTIGGTNYYWPLIDTNSGWLEGDSALAAAGFSVIS